MSDLINIGNAIGDANAEPVRSAFEKVNTYTSGVGVYQLSIQNIAGITVEQKLASAINAATFPTDRTVDKFTLFRTGFLIDGVFTVVYYINTKGTGTFGDGGDLVYGLAGTPQSFGIILMNIENINTFILPTDPPDETSLVNDLNSLTDLLNVASTGGYITVNLGGTETVYQYTGPNEFIGQGQDPIVIGDLQEQEDVASDVTNDQAQSLNIYADNVLVDGKSQYHALFQGDETVKGWILGNDNNWGWLLQQLGIEGEVGALYETIDGSGTNLINSQVSQETGKLYLVKDASSDPAITSGFALYKYLGTTNGTLADYELQKAVNEIAIQDENGIEQFKITDLIQLAGGAFDVANKRFTVSPLVAGNVYLNDTIGNDSTGEWNNVEKPFKTVNGANANFPSEYTGKNVVYHFGTNQTFQQATYNITSAMPPCSIEFRSGQLITLSLDSGFSVVNFFNGSNQGRFTYYINLPSGNVTGTERFLTNGFYHKCIWNIDTYSAGAFSGDNIVQRIRKVRALQSNVFNSLPNSFHVEEIELVNTTLNIRPSSPISFDRITGTGDVSFGGFTGFASENVLKKDIITIGDIDIDGSIVTNQFNKCFLIFNNSKIKVTGTINFVETPTSGDFFYTWITGNIIESNVPINIGQIDAPDSNGLIYDCRVFDFTCFNMGANTFSGLNNSKLRISNSDIKCLGSLAATRNLEDLPSVIEISNSTIEVGNNDLIITDGSNNQPVDVQLKGLHTDANNIGEVGNANITVTQGFTTY